MLALPLTLLRYGSWVMLQPGSREDKRKIMDGGSEWIDIC